MLGSRSWRVVAPALALVWTVGAGCSSCAGARESTEHGASSSRLVAHVTFGAREATHDGLTATETARPARYVDFALLDAAGAELARGATDASGGLDVELVPGAVALRVLAHAHVREIDVAATRDAEGRTLHASTIPLASVLATHTAHVDDSVELAGALHIVDTLLRGSMALERWTGRALPPVFAYWGRGVTTEWSYFRDEVPAGSGRYCLELLGGPLGEQAHTDTDEHDEGIILHELGHFVMNRLAGDVSIAGRHPPGALVDPGVAWEEGRATWFAMAVLAEEEPTRGPFYRDTVGVVPTGSTRIDEDVEHPSGPRGFGSERSVAGVLWDLTDGAPTASGATIVDRDDDGVALGAAAVLDAMATAAAEPGAVPVLSSFLRFLVRTERAPHDALAAMLRQSGEDARLLPPSDVSLWPVDLALGVPSRGHVDGLSDPSPSGAPPRPENGVDAVRVFRFAVPPEGGPFELVLRIDGTGTSSDRTDLELEVRTTRFEVVAHTEGPLREHRLAIPAGLPHAIVLVRDSGTGQRADFELRVEPARR